MITIKNLSFSYTAQKRLFSDINLNFEAGRVYGLLGRNGSGKTTLLNLSAGLTFADHGSPSLLGFSAKERNVAALQRTFFLPEEFALPSMGARLYGSLMGKFYPEFSASKFNGLLQRLEIAPDAKLAQLSHGQKKRFLLAFSLAVHPTVLIMDEPTNGLDIPGKALFRELVAEVDLAKCTIIISTHQINDVAALLTDVTMIEGGEIILNCPLKRVREAFYFGYADELAGEALTPLHHEKEGGRFKYMTLRNDKDKVGADVDIELLFNATLKQRELITNRLDRAEGSPC